MSITSSAGPLTALAALTDEPTSTSDLYDKVGYPALMRCGLIPYKKFRMALVELQMEGLALSETGDDGETLWRRSQAGAGHQRGR